MDPDEPQFDDIEVSAEARDSAQRFIDFLLERKLLALSVKKPSQALLDELARVLEGPGTPSKKAAALSEVLIGSDDVDDLFVEDESLIAIVKRW
jgi:hypothetical protein